jgi:serine protease Do
MPKDRRAEVTGEQPATPALGLALAPADKANGSGEGVVVTKVDPDGPAAERGFKVGDVILDVGGAKVGNPADVSKAVADARSGGKKSVLMRVKSGEQTRFVAVPVGTA